jgi:hypothetical protein
LKRSTLVVATVLLLLVGYIYYFERDPLVEKRADPVFQVEEASIDRIEIWTRGEDTVVIDKTDETWHLYAPISVAADEKEISLLLENLATAEIGRAVGSIVALGLEDFGLVEPVLEVRFRVSGGGEAGLQFGTDTPTGTTQYARRSGEDEILVVAPYLSLNFSKTFWDLRDKRIFDYAEDVMPSRVEIESPEGRLVLENSLGLWFISGETRVRADGFEVEELVSRFRRAEMRDIVSETSEGLESLGLEPHLRALRVEWVDESLFPLEIHVGEESTIDFYARAPARPQVFLIDGALVEVLKKGASAYRSARLFEYTTTSVRRVRVQLMSNPDGGFDIKAAFGEARWSPVEDLLFEMSGVRDEEIVEDPLLEELGLRDPSVNVTVWSDSPEREETIRVGEPIGESVFVQRDGDDVALRVSADAWAAVETLFGLVEAESPE